MNRLPIEGETFGRYRLLRRLGAGGMGVVFAAYDPVLDREVALKLVAPHLAHDEEFRARFAREAALLAKLDSGRAVRIHDQGEQDGTLYIVTQLVDGGDLSAVLREAGALSPALAVELVDQVLEGLEDAHAVGVVHRDVKPGNVLVRQRAGTVEAFLCDFGVATSAGAELTRTGSVAGSLQYMAPERHSGADPGPVGDVYAAGCVLWFALTGSAPYVGTEAEVLLGHLQGRLPQLPGKDPFSKRMNAVLAKALAKDPTKRYPTAAAMRADLEALKPLAAGALQLPGATAIRHTVASKQPPRWRAPLVAVAAVLAVVGAGLAVRAVAGEGEPTADPGTVEVTQTIRGPHGRNLEPRRTLVAAPSASRAAESGEPVVVPQDPELAPPPGGASTTSISSSEPAPAPVRYRCWDRQRIVTRLADCGVPAGMGGFRWLYPKLSGQSCIQPWGTTGGDLVEGWRCSYQTPHGAVGVSILRHTTVTASYDQHTNWFAASVPWTTWSQGGAGLGHRKDGPSRAHPEYYGTGLHYRQIPWGIGISNTAGSRAAVEWFEKNVVGTVRPAGQVLGVRL